MGLTAIETRRHAFDEVMQAGREPFRVADLSLASFGRKEIRLAEQDMPGVMVGRPETGDTPEHPRGIPMFAWKGETRAGYWCTNETLAWPEGVGGLDAGASIIALRIPSNVSRAER